MMIFRCVSLTNFFTFLFTVVSLLVVSLFYVLLGCRFSAFFNVFLCIHNNLPDPLSAGRMIMLSLGA